MMIKTELDSSTGILEGCEVADLDPSLSEIVPAIATGIDAKDDHFIQSLSDMCPESDINAEQLLDIAKVKVEPGSPIEMLRDSNIGLYSEQNSSDLQIAGQILSSIRERFFSDVSSTSEFTQQGANSQPNGLNGMKVQKLDSILAQVNHLLGENAFTNSVSSGLFPNCHLNGFQLSQQVNTKSKICGDQNGVSCSENGSPARNQFAACNVVGLDCVSTTEGMNIEDGSEVQNVGMKQRVKSRHLLPPCRVCGDHASGFHYGANTCEACKVSSVFWQG